MDDYQLQAARDLIEFAREVKYNDARFSPKEVNAAADILEDYLDN
jgi:hypothetical protein